MKVRVKILFIKSHGIRIFEMEKKRFLLVKIICSLSTSEVQIFPVKARSNGRFQRH